jgi:hypothetical protein
MEEMRNEYKILVVIPEGLRPLVRPRHKWEGYPNLGMCNVRPAERIFLARERVEVLFNIFTTMHEVYKIMRRRNFYNIEYFKQWKRKAWSLEPIKVCIQ